MNTQKIASATDVTLTPADILKHWQGHRTLTRRVIEAIPEEALFTHSIGGMRPFAELAMELNRMAAPGAHGVVTGEWKELDVFAKEQGMDASPKTKEGILKRSEEHTSELQSLMRISYAVFCLKKKNKEQH